MRKVYGAFIALTLMGLMIPVGFSGDSDSVVITYGETTQASHEHKDLVNNYFTDNANVNVANTNNKVFSSKNANDLFNAFTNKSYSIDQMYSSCLVDLNKDDNITVNVDSSKITVITGDMYESALKSAGITRGIVYLTSPINITGENALAEVLDSYESVTNMEIPDDVKIAANHEIYVQAEILKDSNITPENLTKLVSAVKNKAINENIDNHTELVKIINKYAKNNNLTMLNEDTENLANAIGDVQSAQDGAKYYEKEILDFTDGNIDSELSIYNLV